MVMDERTAEIATRALYRWYFHKRCTGRVTTLGDDPVYGQIRGVVDKVLARPNPTGELLIKEVISLQLVDEERMEKHAA